MKNEDLKGIGGWLILPTIGLVIGAIFYPIIAAVTYDRVLLISYAVLSVLCIASLWFEFKKRKFFPKLMIITLWAGAIIGAIVTVFNCINNVDPALGFKPDIYFCLGYTGPFTLFSVLITIIWTWYFCVSKRVKNTFVN